MSSFDIFSEASINQKAVVLFEGGTARLTIGNVGNGKYAIQDYSDEATHKSDMEVSMDLHTAKVTFTGATGCSYFKMNQNVDAEICLLSHVIIDAKAETKTPFMRNSVAELKFQAKVEDLKIDFTASHNAELVGQVEGTLSNSILALVSPTELMFDTKNKGNAVVVLPFKLSGKMDLQNDIALTLNSEVQQASWTGLARFNQYKYSHYFTMDNGDREINIFAQINGEANLDMLKEHIAIPEMTVPFFDVTIPRIEGSLWEEGRLSKFLITTQQTFDMDAKLKYMKNPDMITIDIDMEPMVNVINRNVRNVHKNMLVGKDKAVAILTTSYDKAKAEYEKYNIEMPKTVTVPAYRVPVMNVETSSFTIPLPDLNLITMPDLQVPSALKKLTFPKITLPKMQRSIMIPVMGDLTYEFSMKTAMITLKTDASIVNQGDIIIRLDASSSSELEVLTGKIEGTSTMNRVNGFKVASVLSVKHMMVEGNHDSTISFSKGVMDTSITNSVKVDLPILWMEINQELFGNPQEGLILSVSSPALGLLGLQMQTKRPAQVKGRLYGRYPSEPTQDVDILAVKMSVVDFEKLSLQTTWNMEMPYETMMNTKRMVPALMEVVYIPIVKSYAGMSKLAEEATEQGKIMVKRATDNLAALNLPSMTTRVTDNTVMILKAYQKNFEMLLDAAIKFLRETKFQIPGYEEKLSGLEVYQKFSAFVADVTQEAIEKFPDFFESVMYNPFTAIQFTLPGSSYTVNGQEILDELMMAMKKIQDQMIVIVKKLGRIQLEDIIMKLSEFMHFTIDKSEKLLQTLKSQNVGSWVNEVYTDAMHSRVLNDIGNQVRDSWRSVEPYIHAVRERLQEMFADMSFEQLQADIRSWIDSFAKSLNRFHNNVIELLKEKSKNVPQFVRVSDRQMDVDIPFPFIAKF